MSGVKARRSEHMKKTQEISGDRLDALEDAYLRLLDGDDGSLRKAVHEFDGDVRVQALSTTGGDGGRREGDDGPVLLFVHGTSASSVGFAEAMKTIAAWSPYSELHAIDLPGFGRSPAFPRQPKETALRSFTSVIEKYVETVLGGRRVVLMGHSFGGFMCIHYASRFPHRVSKLVLVGAGGIYPLLGEWGNYCALFFKARLPQSLCRSLTRIPVVGRIAKRCVEGLIERALSSPRDSAFASYYLELLCDDRVQAHAYVGDFVDTKLRGSRWNAPALGELATVLRRFRVPVCMIYGEFDAVTPSHQGTELTRIFPDDPLLRVEVIRGSGHAPYSDVGMRDFCAVVKSVLETTEPDSPPTPRGEEVDLEAVKRLLLPFRGTFNIERMRREVDTQYTILRREFMRGSPSPEQFLQTPQDDPEPEEVQGEQERRRQEEHRSHSG